MSNRPVVVLSSDVRIEKRVLHFVFANYVEAVERASRIVQLFDDAGDDVGVLSLDGQMIDKPHLRQAQKILDRSRSARQD